jgi:hypothetical protein
MKKISGIILLFFVLTFFFGYFGFVIEDYVSQEHIFDQKYPSLFDFYSSGTNVTLDRVDHFLDRGYDTLRLFSIDDDTKEKVENPVSQLAKISAAILAILTLILAFHYLFDDEIKIFFYLLFRSNHIVVCGAGIKGSALIYNLKKKGKIIIFIEQDENNPNISALRAEGALIKIGDAKQRKILEECGVSKADSIYIYVDDDISAIKILKEIQQIFEQKKETVNLYEERSLAFSGWILDIINAEKKGYSQKNNLVLCSLLRLITFLFYRIIILIWWVLSDFLILLCEYISIILNGIQFILRLIIKSFLSCLYPVYPRNDSSNNTAQKVFINLSNSDICLGLKIHQHGNQENLKIHIINSDFLTGLSAYEKAMQKVSDLDATDKKSYIQIIGTGPIIEYFIINLLYSRYLKRENESHGIGMRNVYKPVIRIIDPDANTYTKYLLKKYPRIHQDCVLRSYPMIVKSNKFLEYLENIHVGGLFFIHLTDDYSAMSSGFSICESLMRNSNIKQNRIPVLIVTNNFHSDTWDESSQYQLNGDKELKKVIPSCVDISPSQFTLISIQDEIHNTTFPEYDLFAGLTEWAKYEESDINPHKFFLYDNDRKDANLKLFNHYIQYGYNLSSQNKDVNRIRYNDVPYYMVEKTDLKYFNCNDQVFYEPNSKNKTDLHSFLCNQFTMDDGSTHPINKFYYLDFEKFWMNLVPLATLYYKNVLR